MCNTTVIDSEAAQYGMAILLVCIGRSPRRSFPHHAFMLHCTFSPTSWPSGGSIAHHKGRGRLLAAFNVTLLISVLEIPFNFSFDMQCAGNANSNVSQCKFWANFISMTHLSKIKGVENNRVWMARSAREDRACRVARDGGDFSRGQPPQDNSVGSGVVWVKGLFSLWYNTTVTDSEATHYGMVIPPWVYISVRRGPLSCVSVSQWQRHRQVMVGLALWWRADRQSRRKTQNMDPEWLVSISWLHALVRKGF